MNRNFRFVSLGIALSVLASVSACSTPTPTAPTPVPVPVPVVDPPTIACAASSSTTSALAAPLAVDYAAPVVSGGVAPVTTTCTPASGSVFPIGSTTVTCTALDAKQRASSCILNITVTPPPRISLTRIIAFGDSITAGEDGTNPAILNPFGSSKSIILIGRQYPTDLLASLQSWYTLQTSSIVVANDGLPSEYAGSSSTVARFSRDVTSGGYQAVLLMEGPTMSETPIAADRH